MKILTVDDSFDWLNINTDTVRDVFGEDTEIVGASSAAEGLEIFKSDYREEPYDLVITDLQMEKDYEPLFAGEWLIKEIRELKSNQKILIVSSAYVIDQIARQYSVDYVSKRNIVNNIEYYKDKLGYLYK